MIDTALHIVTPGGQAVTTADGKQHLRVDYAVTADNTEIDNIIQAATSMVEAFCSRTFISTVFDFYLTDFPSGGIVLPTSPVTAISSVKYYTDATTEVTLDAANYYYNIHEEPCKIRWNNNRPAAYDYRADAVTVRFTAGYADADSVPRTLRQALLLVLGDLYENRSDAVRERLTLWKMGCYADRVIHNLMENQ